MQLSRPTWGGNRQQSPTIGLEAPQTSLSLPPERRCPRVHAAWRVSSKGARCARRAVRARAPATR
eukprot:6002059-Alexandrium_andersonii.AAC.1